MTGRTARPRGHSDRPARAIALVVLGTGLITLNDAAMKLVVSDHGAGQAIFVRGLFALLPISFLVLRAGGWQALRWRSLGGQSLSALLLVAAMFMFIFSLSQLPLAIAVIMIYTNPLFATALAPLVLGERVGWRRWSAVAVGFAGALLVIQPDSVGFSWLILVPMLAAFVVALRDLLTRRLVAGETSVSILAFSSLLVTLCALPTVALGWTALGASDFALLAGAGLAFGFAMFCLTDALRYGDVSLISPFKYAGVVLAVVIGYLVWDEVPNLQALLGAVVITASGLFILYRQDRRRRS